MRTINLLPKPKQQELRYQMVAENLKVVVWISVVSFLVVFAAQCMIKAYLAEQYSALQHQIAGLQNQVDQQDNQGLKTQVQAVNNTVTDFNTLAAQNPRWSSMLKAFAPLPPPGLQITTLAADAQSRTVTITGYAPTRDLVIELYDNLINDKKDFSNVDYPLDNISKGDDINFHFSFTVNNSVLSANE